MAHGLAGPMLALLFACANPSPPAPDDGAGTPAEITAPAGDRARYTLVDGQEVEGERVHRFDPRLWWHPTAEEGVLLVCEPSLDGPYPNDGSLRLLPESWVAQTEAQPPSEPSCTEFARQTGRYLARSPLDGPALVWMGQEGYHLEEDGFGDFAWDLVVTGPQGRRFMGTGEKNEHYYVWDQPLYAPSAGEVVEVVDTGEDQTPGSHPPDAVNNLVGIHLAGQTYVYILHLRQGSATVQVGDWVEAGDLIGRAGNAGVSLEPHVHITLLHYEVDPIDGSAPRTWAMPGEWRDVFVSDEPPSDSAGPAVSRPWAVPQTGQWVSASPL